MKERVRLQVLSSFEDKPGTLVCDEDEIVEQELVSGLTYSKQEAKVTLVGVRDKPGISAIIFGPLADANINVDMIIQNVTPDGRLTDVTFTVPEGDLPRSLQVIEKAKDEIGYDRLMSDDGVAKISVVGVGMRSHAGVASKMFKTLADKGINIQAITTSEIKVSVLVDMEYTELALRALHTAYDLDQD
jgi:aspartate kinase